MGKEVLVSFFSDLTPAGIAVGFVQLLIRSHAKSCAMVLCFYYPSVIPIKGLWLKTHLVLLSHLLQALNLLGELPLMHR